jgi:hypothetical protein
MADHFIIADDINANSHSELDRLASYFHLNSHSYQGRLGIYNLPGFYVSYDTKVGAAILQSEQTHQFITESYSPSITQHLTSIILPAIAYYAKFHLLKKINELSDEQYPGAIDLKAIIARYRVTATTGVRIETTAVTKSVQAICAHINSNQSRFNNMNSDSIANIQSLNDANSTVNQLKSAILATITSAVKPSLKK